jgi:hypothetical protein
VITCSECGTSIDPELYHGRDPRAGEAEHPEQVWCPTCTSWLVYYDSTRQWLNPDSTDYWRRSQAGYALVIGVSHRRATAALPDAQALAPPGWQAGLHHNLPGAGYTLRLIPPAGPFDVAAYLSPPTGDGGWQVTIHNRTRRIGYPLYVAGGAHAASYATLTDAVHAAVDAVDTDQRLT